MDHDKANQWVEDSEPTPILKHTVGNRGAVYAEYEDDDITVQIFLNYAVIAIILVLANILRWRQLAIEKKIDEKNITPADFTVYVMNLPKEKNQAEVKVWFEEYNKNQNWKVSKVNFCYDIQDVVKRIRSLEKWNKIRNYNQHKAKTMVEDKKISMEEAIKKIKGYAQAEKKAIKYAGIIEGIKKEIDAKDDKEYYCQRAFVTFEDELTADRVVRKYKMFYLVKLFWFVWYKIFRCKNSKANRRYWEGDRVVVERATEPGDVYWENLSVSDMERTARQLLTYFITACCLGIAFSIYNGLNSLSSYLDDRATEDDASSGDLWMVRIVNALSSVITMIINVCLDIVIRLLSSYEKHRSYTQFHLSVAIKLMASTFINSALLPLSINLDTEDWFTNNGLAMTIFYNTLSVSFVSTLLYLFNIGYLLKKIKICLEKRKGVNSKLTQRQANELFEGPKVDMAMLYSRTGMLYLLICFYTPMIPGIAMIGVLGIFLQYWVEKYLLLRRHKVPEAMGSAMAKFYSSLIPMGMVLYAIGNYVFVLKLSDDKNGDGQWALWFMIAYYVLPIGFILNIFTVRAKRDKSLKYENAMFTFVQDYDRENPNQAKSDYLKAMKERQCTDQEKADIDKELHKSEKGNLFKSLNNYGKNKKGLETDKFDTKYKDDNKKGKKGKKGNKKRSNVPNKYLAKLHKKFDKGNDKKPSKNVFGMVSASIGGKKQLATKGQILPFSNGVETVHEHNDSDTPLNRGTEEAKNSGYNS
jgi:hypothetical protein